MSPKHWTKSARSTRTAFLGSLLLIGAIAIYSWIVAPHRSYLLAAQRYGSTADNLAKKNQTISNNVTIKRKELKELHEKFSQVRGRLFDPVEAGKFFSNIQAKAEEANCIVYSLTFSSGSSASGADRPEADSHITAQRATLSVLGGYGNIVALVNKLQDCSKKVRIDSVRIYSDNKNSAHLKCDMTVTIYVIYGKEEHQHD